LLVDPKTLPTRQAHCRQQSQNGHDHQPLYQGKTPWQSIFWGAMASLYGQQLEAPFESSMTQRVRPWLSTLISAQSLF